MNVWVKMAALAGLVLLVGCAGSPYAPERERSSIPVEELPEPETREPAEVQRPEPAEVEEPRTPSAVDTLLNSARRQYDAGQYEAAIATAERALRMERGNAEIYLVIGHSYLALLQTEMAGQFARQGLAFAAAGSSVRRQLQALLTRASH